MQKNKVNIIKWIVFLLHIQDFSGVRFSAPKPVIQTRISRGFFGLFLYRPHYGSNFSIHHSESSSHVTERNPYSYAVRDTKGMNKLEATVFVF
jgi:hypothetical protein